MELREFATMQYDALRSEILGIKERVIKLQLLGVAGIPLVIGAGEKYDIKAVIIFGPLIVLVFALILLFEQASLMRAGEYIKDNLEPILANTNLNGWEKWLQMEPKRRKAEKYFAWSAHIAFGVYFVIGIIFSYNLLVKINTALSFAVIGAYCGGFILALYLVITNFRIGTDAHN